MSMITRAAQRKRSLKRNRNTLWLFVMVGIFIALIHNLLDFYARHSEYKTLEAENKRMENSELMQLMYDLQQAYLRQQHWYYPYALDFCIDKLGKQYQLQPDDLERITFYKDNMTQLIYFVPENEQWEENFGTEQREMFVFQVEKICTRRGITSQPDEIQYCVYPTDVADIKERLVNLGTVEFEFSDKKIAGSNTSITENEYTQAVKDMVHGTLMENERYGKYQIYIGEYFVTDNTGIYAEELEDTAIQISAAVICMDDGYGYYCRFLASDLLVDGNVKIYYYVSDTANIWEEVIRQAMTDNRYVISLEVNAEDDVEIPVNPYPFVMLPILNNAVGNGRYPESAIYGENIFY